MKSLKGLRIGILGGIGPEATGELYLKIIRKLQERNLVKENTEFPQIIINSIPAPEIFLNMKNKEQLKIYIDGIRELNKHKLDLIIIACNTTYAFYEDFKKVSEAPILDLIKEIKNRIGNNPVLVLASSGTLNSGIYLFSDNKNVKISEEDKLLLDKSVFLFNSGKNKEEQKKKVQNLVEKYYTNKKTFILLGCTEIALMLKDLKIENKIDSLEVLADATIDSMLKFIKERPL